ncbi:neuropeptide S receptor isoform X2 [Zalophus californianus]|uniref:Neuropeptide S receptor isoform X2 n=1 Tax=Zalophus californianus TaxID=9704 RepID=A0A6J2BED0_ZALCA|nr:neuropeptide S receptor isoform X2 [Zalophus californianus]
MPANLTERGPDSDASSGTTQTLDASPVLCTETVTFTEVVEGEEWGSSYYSFKTEQLITLWILFVFTIVGNSMVLFSMWRRKMKSRMTFFVTQLAITEKQAKVLIVIAWSLSFLFSIPALIVFGKRKLSNSEVQCWALWPDDSYWTPYMTIVAFLVYFIPLTIISAIYAIVIRTIWIKSKAHETVISNCSDGKLCTSYHRGLISKAKIKAIKYSIVIILAFICCWSPYFFFDILDNFSLLPDTKERVYASVIIQNLPPLNSAINSLIYCVFSSSICFPCREQTSRDSRMTFQERTQRHEMQVLSKPELV